MSNFLLKQRELAQARFAELPWPTKKDENFRFTAIEKILAKQLEGVENAVSDFRPDHESALCRWGDLIKVEGSAENIVWETWDKLSPVVQEKVQERMEKHNQGFDEKVMAKIAGSVSSPLVLYIPKNTKVKLPLRLLVQNTGGAIFRSVVLADENSEVSFITEIAGGSSDCSYLGMVDFFLEKNSTVNCFEYQHLNSVVDFVFRTRFILSSEAKINYIPVHFGGKCGQWKAHAKLNGTGAQVNIHAALKAMDQELDFWCEVEHNAPHSSSNLEAYFIGDGHSRTVFNGIVKIPAGMIGSEAYQKHKTLLVSKDSQVNTFPKLEIATDEVKCAHGASVSNVSEEQLFYLESRGIGPAKAREMLIEAFLQSVLIKLSPLNLWEQVEGQFLQ